MLGARPSGPHSKPGWKIEHNNGGSALGNSIPIKHLSCHRKFDPPTDSPDEGKKKGANKQVRYHRVPEMWRRGEKLEYLVSGKVPWRTLIPDAKHTWLVPAHGDEYGGLLAIKSMFALQSLGLNTNRDEVVFDFDRSRLTTGCNASSSTAT